MDKIVSDFLQRNLAQFKNDIEYIKADDLGSDFYSVKACGGKVYIRANNFVSFCSGLYSYLQKYCKVQLSWCGNREIKIDKLIMFDGEMKNVIEQKFRVYLNYCTFDYSMCWWDFQRWEKEIDFMAMNGINMPLCIVGTEAVLYYTLLEYGFTKQEALSAITGPAFWSWQLMTNIDSYLPPQDESYIKRRLELGRKIINRFAEFGMTPIQQGFSGHVPALFKKKYKKAKILYKHGWCNFPGTAQIDPLDPLFTKFGLSYLVNMKKLFGNYHYLACDPFHEGTPPENNQKYLNAVGTAINGMYKSFDEHSVWVMQGWTPYEHIIKAVPKDRLLILDLDSLHYKKFDNFYGYNVVAGMLHNFGGKNAMQGQIKKHCSNAYLRLKNDGVNVAGSGMFMEGIEQNPVLYDLQFHMLTQNGKIDFEEWLKNYIIRRYGEYNENLKSAWDIMTETCYCDDGYKENEVGSALASRPSPMPVLTGPCCNTNIWYDTKKLHNALRLFISVSSLYKNSDGYQYDLCDLTRQVMSNLFHDNQVKFKEAYDKKDLISVKAISKEQLELLSDLDKLLSHRSELSFSKYICDCHNLASDENEKKYFDLNARALVSLWGDIRSSSSYLYDYSWREWSGMVNEYYRKRWDIFYKEIIKNLEKHRKTRILSGDTDVKRKKYRSYKLGRMLYKFEFSFINDFKDYDYPEDKDVTGYADKMFKKWIENKIEYGDSQ